MIRKAHTGLISWDLAYCIGCCRESHRVFISWVDFFSISFFPFISIIFFFNASFLFYKLASFFIVFSLSDYCIIMISWKIFSTIQFYNNLKILRLGLTFSMISIFSFSYFSYLYIYDCIIMIDCLWWCPILLSPAPKKSFSKFSASLSSIMFAG